MNNENQSTDGVPVTVDVNTLTLHELSVLLNNLYNELGQLEVIKQSKFQAITMVTQTYQKKMKEQEEAHNKIVLPKLKKIEKPTNLT